MEVGERVYHTNRSKIGHLSHTAARVVPCVAVLVTHPANIIEYFGIYKSKKIRLNMLDYL